ncbi:MAG TPA: DUF4388 domain-containing protein [Thermoanaerobaculia bacterium]|nr:DUF4388 domain-containing protein [Thermoanaerobaculia bacterium]HQR66800.1 DUF4388 domain-containing protein [Thermoanaerobaculia bacterium]
MTDPLPPGESKEITSDVREALTELQRYLSDAIAPLMVAESMTLLLEYPAELTAFEINAWTAAQFRSKMGTVPVSDYLYHAVDKIFQLGSYGLVPKDRMREYLDELIPIVVHQAPEDDRDLLRANLARLGEGDSMVASTVEVLRRQVGSQNPLATEKGAGAGAAGGREGPLPDELSKKLKRFSMLLERWEAGAGEGEKGAPGTDSTAGGSTGARAPGGAAAREGATAERRKKNEALLSQLLSNAATGSDSDKELSAALDKLRRIGLEMQTAEAFRVLGRALPGWVVPPGVEATEQTGSSARGSASAAIRKIVTLPEDPVEVGKRFHEMLQAAVEQFNKGSLPRAAKMFEVAERLIAEKRIDATAVDVACRRAFDGLDMEKLRSLGEHPEKHPLLRKVLNFFPGLRVGALLDDVRIEEKRERRRLLLSLLEVHGTDARDAALGRLQQMVRDGEAPEDEWHYKRNLLYVLRRVPRPAEQPAEKELEAVVRLSEPGLPAPLVKEALAALGQIKHEKAEAALIQRVQGLEQLLSRKGDAPFDEAELQPLLERAVTTLARLGTPTSRRVVVEHALRKKGPLGDAAPRLAELAAQDLSDDPELVAFLLKSLRAELPFKVLGLVLKKNDERIAQIIEAFAATPLPQVRKLLETIVESFPNQEFARVAGKVLAGFETRQVQETATASLSGDLELFELPSLLQSLGVSEVKGVLVLRDQKGNAVGSITMEQGKVRGAQIGILKGDDACYQFFERPFPGTFAFTKQDLPPRREADPPLREVVPLLLEGMRRYDEFQRAAALVPDDLYLASSGQKPTALAEETDAVLQQQVWARAAAGASPRLCEESIPADSFRIRRLFAHWLEEGSLKPV